MAEIATLPADTTGLVRQLVQQGRDAAAAGHLKVAEQSFARALAIDPEDVAAQIDYGCFLIETKNYQWGYQYTRAALGNPRIEGDPGQQAVCWNNLGYLSYRDRRIDEAVGAFTRSIELNPWYKIPVVSRGAAYVVMGEFEKAYGEFDRAALIAPGDFEPIWNKSIVKLTQGDWVMGLPGYETRKVEHESKWPVPRWKGEDLTGKTIIVWAEQGFGDNIWAHRLVREMTRKGAKEVCLCTYAQLEPILPLDGIRVVHEGDQIEVLHYQVPTMSLLYGLRIKPAQPPAPSGLVPPMPDVRRRWSSVRKEGKFNVGLSWSGNVSHKFDDLRSIPLAAFEALWSGMDAVSFHALQKDTRPGDGAALKASPIRFYGEEIKTFADAAAIAEQMDLIISVDTAALHLGAEMGRPVWGLIPYSPDFRWGTSGDDCPWYPTLKLYRKDTALGSWENTLLRVRSDLEKLCASR